MTRALLGVAYVLWCALLEPYDRRWREMMRRDCYRTGGSQHG